MTTKDNPDWTREVRVVAYLEQTVIFDEPERQVAICVLDRLTTSSTSYGTLVSWTVAADRLGVLHDIEMESDNYAKTRFKLTINGVVKFTDQQLEGALSLSFPDVKLSPGVVVLLEAKSSDGTQVNADGVITGKEMW